MLFSLLMALSAQAHVETGVYKGTTTLGQACEMRAIDMKFEGGLHHPLTERVVVDYNGDTFSVGHPSAIERTEGKVTFNHDLFQGVLPNSNGAKALTIEMEHSQKYEGPVAFEVIDHNWRTKVATSIRCENLKLN